MNPIETDANVKCVKSAALLDEEIDDAMHRTP